MTLTPRSILHGVSLKTFFRDLKREINEDNVFNGGAALAYYLLLSIFPAMIFLLSLLPYLPIQNIDRAIMDLLHQAMPGDAADVFTRTVTEITSQKKGGLLSVGLILALWAASNGMYAIMQQLNITYDVEERRSFIKTRWVALELTLIFGALVIGAFALVVVGGKLEELLAHAIGSGGAVVAMFAAVRWGLILGAMLLGISMTYYLGPDVKQKFRFVTPGGVLACALLIGSSLGFRAYVSHFGNYNATYGSLGAVIVLMLWLYITGVVLLLGSEVNALIEHYSPEGKDKGERAPGAGREDPPGQTQLPPRTAA